MNNKGVRGYNEPCNYCGLFVENDAPEIPRGGKPDPCLGVIPGVVHACCGHGDTEMAYAIVADAEPGTSYAALINCTEYRGDHAITFFNKFGLGPLWRAVRSYR